MMSSCQASCDPRPTKTSMVGPLLAFLSLVLMVGYVCFMLSSMFWFPYVRTFRWTGIVITRYQDPCDSEEKLSISSTLMKHKGEYYWKFNHYLDVDQLINPNCKKVEPTEAKL